MPRRDPVTPELRIRILERDRICIAAKMGEYDCAGPATLDHVQDGYGRMGKRAPSDERHLVTLCWHHHLDGWATANRPALREYLRVVNEEAAA